jgi:lipopolysaccharide transport system ATP-binding protein
MSSVITVENLSKKYIIGHQKQERYNTMRDVLANGAKRLTNKLIHPFAAPVNDSTHEEFWALKDVSFDIQQGDRVGIIGRNGAGKSTLLKILSRITEPTSGKISIKGRVASLLEVGTGFHPELSGRENIYLNGAILGMRKAEIKSKFDEIVAFAEVEKFLDTPVKRYSSGMYVRLAFAVAAHLEPEILIVDEVLAVGDVQFQKKCLGKMEEVGQEGRTILFVSHNMTAIESLCKGAIMLSNGSINCAGDVSTVIPEYLSLSDSTEIGSREVSFEDADFPDSSIAFRAVRVMDSSGRLRSDFINTESITVEMEVLVREYVPNLRIGFDLKTYKNTVLFRTFSNDAKEIMEGKSSAGRNYILRTTIPAKLLNAGIYYINLAAGIHNKRWLVKDLSALFINVVFEIPNSNYFGSSRPGDIAPILNWSALPKEREK